MNSNVSICGNALIIPLTTFRLLMISAICVIYLFHHLVLIVLNVSRVVGQSRSELSVASDYRVIYLRPCLNVGTQNTPDPFTGWLIPVVCGRINGVETLSGVSDLFLQAIPQCNGLTSCAAT